MKYTHKTKVGRYTVSDSGCPPKRLQADGSPVLSAEQISALERRATLTVLREVELVSGAELRFARKALGLRQVELAEQLGVTPETVSRWETGTEPFRRTVQLAVCALLEAAQRGAELPRKRTTKSLNLRVA